MGGTVEINDACVEDTSLREEAGGSGESLAICLVSGGMDSCVTAAIAHRKNERLAFLHVSYGQRTEQRERQAFEAIADHYRVSPRLAVSIEHLAVIGGSSLTDTSVPVSKADLASKIIPTSYVPFRNSHFLSIATSWGEVIGARYIYVRAVSEVSSGYSDCRPEFFETLSHSLRCENQTENKVKI